MDHKLSLCICILFFEKAGQTIECVQSFLPSGVPIYILNNNSSQESTQTLKDFCKDHPQVTIFDSPENLGVSGGRNYLIKNTKEEWMFFVDNDITVKTPDWLEKITGLIEANPEVEAFVMKLFNVHNDSYSNYFPFIIKDNTLIGDHEFQGEEINRFPGGASVVNRKVYDRLGFYSEQMFVGFEDYEMALRAMVGGQPIKAKKTESVELVHDHRIAANEQDKQSAKVRYDMDKHKASEKYIEETYGIKLEPSWCYWLQNQKRLLVDGKKIKPLNYLQRAKLKVIRTMRKVG